MFTYLLKSFVGLKLDQLVLDFTPKQEAKDHVEPPPCLKCGGCLCALISLRPNTFVLHVGGMDHVHEPFCFHSFWGSADSDKARGEIVCLVLIDDDDK